MVDKQLNYGRHHIFNFLQNAMPFETVLDLGSGKGDDLDLAKSINLNASLHAIEGYPPYVEHLKSKNINVYNLDVERDKIPFENESVDVIIMNQIMEHVKDVYWIFHEVTRVLKVGGHFIVGVPNLASLHNRLLLAIGEQPTCIQNDSAHVRGYTKKDFNKLADCGFKNGYKLNNFGGSNFYPFPPIIAKPLAKLLPKMAWSIFMDWQKTIKYSDNGYLEYPQKNKLETKFYLGK
jgi:SAM-dependent methyltransferase